MKTRKNFQLDCWSLNSISLGNSYADIIRKKGEPTLNSEIKGKLISSHFQVTESQTISVYFNEGFGWEKPSFDQTTSTVTSVIGFELVGPDSLSLSEGATSQEVIKALGEPDTVIGPRSTGNVVWKYAAKSGVNIDIYIQGDTVRAFFLRDPSLSDSPGEIHLQESQEVLNPSSNRADLEDLVNFNF